VGRTDVTSAAAEFAEIAAALHESEGVEDTLDAVMLFTLKAVDCSHAGVAFVRAGKQLETVADTGPVVRDLHAVEARLGEGPEMSLLEDMSVRIDDTLEDLRWPAWAAVAAEAGLRSMVGAHLFVSDESLGTLSVYDSRPGHFTEADRAVVQVLARHAAIALDNVQDNAGLLKALDSRKLIGMAEGILMERFGIDDDVAFGVLRRYSMDKNMKLRDVAQTVVDTRRLPS
jgi:GAF domain-containing protein